MNLRSLLAKHQIKSQARLPHELVKDFQTWLSSPAFEDRSDHKRTGSFYPSKWADCDRSMALEFVKAPQNFVSHDPRLKITFEFGHAMHAQLQALFRRHAEYKGWEFLDEVRITRDTNPWFVSGRIDGVHYRPVTDRRSAVEFKSINSGGFASLWSGPHDGHLVQGNTYLGLAPYPLDDMHFIYVNKDTSAMKEFVRPFDKELFRQNMSRIERILLQLKRNRFPSCEKCTRRCPFHEFNTSRPYAKPAQLADDEKLAEITAFEPRYVKPLRLLK